MLTKNGELTNRDRSVLGHGLLHVLFSTRENILQGLQNRLHQSMAEHDRDIREHSVSLQALRGSRECPRGSQARALFDEIWQSKDLIREMAQLLPRRDGFDTSVDENFGHAYRIAKERLGKRLR